MAPARRRLPPSWRGTLPGAGHSAGHPLSCPGGAAGPEAVRLSGSHQPRDHRIRAAGHAARDPGTGAAGAGPASDLGTGVDAPPGAIQPRRWSRPSPGARVMPAGRRDAQLFPALGAYVGSIAAGAHCRRRGSWGNSSFALAQREAEPMHRLGAHEMLGSTLYYLGEYAAARAHWSRGSPCIDPAAQRALALRHGEASGVRCLACGLDAVVPGLSRRRPVRRSQEALALAQVLAHSHSLAFAQYFAAYMHHRRREAVAVQAQVETLLTLATTQGFPALGGAWTRAGGLAADHAGPGRGWPGADAPGSGGRLGHGEDAGTAVLPVLLAEMAGNVRQVAEGLRLLAEAWDFEASGRGTCSRGSAPGRPAAPGRQRYQATDTGAESSCFQQALAIARRQQAKVLGAAGRREPKPPVAAAGQAGRRPGAAGTALRVVQRGLRHG